MSQIVRPTSEIQVVDLVLDPFMYREALIAPMREGQLDGAALDHLNEVLPLAIAQLDALGDVYGALALAGLESELTGLEALV
jgi:hypothetical protein